MTILKIFRPGNGVLEIRPVVSKIALAAHLILLAAGIIVIFDGINKPSAPPNLLHIRIMELAVGGTLAAIGSLMLLIDYYISALSRNRPLSINIGANTVTVKHRGFIDVRPIQEVIGFVDTDFSTAISYEQILKEKCEKEGSWRGYIFQLIPTEQALWYCDLDGWIKILYKDGSFAVAGATKRKNCGALISGLYEFLGISRPTDVAEINRIPELEELALRRKSGQ